MPDISKVKLPSGNVYDIKDAVARELIAGGVSFFIAWNGSSTPDVTKIPEGVVVTYNSTNYTGTLAPSAAQAGAFYLVKSSTQTEVLDVYDEYSVIKPTTTSSSWFWEKIGDTKLDLSDLGALAYKDNVTLNKGTGDTVLGTDATFTTTVTPTTTNIKATASGTAVGANGTASAITGFGAHIGQSVLSDTATFTTEVTPTTTNVSATASGGGAAWNSKDSKTVLTGVKVTTQPTVALSTGATAGDGVISVATGITSASASFSSTDSKTCLTGVSASKKKLTTTSVPNVTSAGSASTWSFTMGTGNDAETLIIGGANSTAPTLGTAITCATGGLSDTSVSTNVGETVAIDASSSGTATVVGTSATLSASVTPTTTNIKATASGTAVGANGTASVIGANSTFTNTQPTIELATGATAGTGVISVATGITSATTSVDSGSDVTVLKSLGTPTTETVLTGVQVTSQPTVALSTGATAGTGVISVATGITSSTTSVNSADSVKVAKYDDLSVTVS